MADDIRQWLEGLKLGEYADQFEENRITLGHLADLSDDDFKELGVVALGDRKTLKSAIAARAVPSMPASSADAGLPARQGTAESRHLTVMFCDLVGSTALSGRLDPEDLREVMRVYQNTVAGEIARFEGHLAKFMGDGVIAYFGYPRAHEDDAERAVRTALAVVEAMAKLTRDGAAPLQVRIGIATGQVVVGDLIGEGAAQEEAVIGETPNLAARLQELAEPNSVVISDATRELTGNVFDAVDLGAQTLKGFSAPVQVWRINGERQLESRFAARSARLTRFVGRDHEVGLLLERWQRARDGEGQVVMLSGEAGIGKSRILESVRERLGTEAHTLLRYQCSPYHTNSALYPVTGQLERAAGFTVDDPVDARIDKLEQLLSSASEDLAQAMPLLASLLSLSLGNRYPPLELSPQMQKSRTLTLLTEQVLALAERQPVLCLFEDAHWIDPTSLELLEQVIDRLADARILLLITYRPEFEASWQQHAHVSALALNRLSRSQCAEIIRDLSEGKALSAQVLEQIAGKTDGVPLFVEELTKTVLESGLLADADSGSTPGAPLPALAIPNTLKDSLMARLDRLAGAKELAQVGATIGREFPHKLLAAVAGWPEDELQSALAQLIEAELVIRRGDGSGTSYLFKHALVQDVAYESLLRSRRQALHRQIAEALNEQFAEIAESEPELLAHHYTGAGLTDQAIAYWQTAGARALRRSANIEAINHLSQGLDMLASLPDTPERAGLELSLQLALGPALMAQKGQGAPEARQAYARARELGREIGDTGKHFQALWGSWRSHFTQSEHQAACELGEHCVKLAEESGDDVFLLEARFALGGSLTFMGDFAAAEAQLAEAIPLYDLDRHRGLAFDYGQDPGASNLAYQSWVLWFTGHPVRAVERGREALALAETLAHPFTLAQVSMYMAMTLALCRDWPELRSQARATIVLSNKHGFPQTLHLCSILDGRVAVEDGQLDSGIRQIEAGITARKATGVSAGRIFELALLAEGYGRAERTEEALEILAEAQGFSERTGEGYYVPEIYRLKGELLLQRDGLDGAAAAEVCFNQGLDVARRQQAKSLELRAATSLAELWRVRKKIAAAGNLLWPIYDGFTEGFDMPDLVKARTLLDNLK